MKPDRDHYGITDAGYTIMSQARYHFTGALPTSAPGAHDLMAKMREAQAELIAAHLERMAPKDRTRAEHMLVALTNAPPYPAPIPYPTEHLA